ncbi:hypothetical protein Gotur_024599 [Gossypium turneri]
MPFLWRHETVVAFLSSVSHGRLFSCYKCYARARMDAELIDVYLFYFIFPLIELKTAPADFRFPTTNQTRHCFTRYIEFHRCLAAKGESKECERFAKYYRSLCPGEWVERWNEQRENGTFPGPL